MHIESVTISNFRCFGPEPTKITLSPDITALIGSNGTGKSSFIEALRRVFGISREERALTRADVHFGPDENPEDVLERQIFIDIVFAFSELEDDNPDAIRTIPEVFRALTASGPGESLKSRLRLEALWRHGESFVDDIESTNYWISHLDDVDFGEDAGGGLDKQRVHATDRGKIQLIYVPATRDSTAVTRRVLRSLLSRLERSGDFGTKTESEIQQISENLQNKISDLTSVDWITEKLQAHWDCLHDAEHLKSARFVVLSREFTQILRSLSVKLSPSPEGRERSIDELSEGQTSLLFLTLEATLADLETELTRDQPPSGFKNLDTTPPVLKIYAVEEPENHLAPFFLSRLMQLLSELCSGVQATGLITSHSPSVLRRLQPEAVRHFRLDTNKMISHVNNVRLPLNDQVANKFVRQAFLAQPEIYFAKLVILGEGDSEAVVLPRVARALDIDLDPSFVAFAPLGGRHVNHFWKLLSDLDIPYLTLLDFDLGRRNAGQLRLKYAYEQLNHFDKFNPPEGTTGDLSNIEYWKALSHTEIESWLQCLEDKNVYFCYPMDLDMTMLHAYPEAYGVCEEQAPDDDVSLRKLGKSVFGQGPGLESFEQFSASENIPAYQELLTYDTLFKKRSKPVSHLQALALLEDDDIADNCPKVLNQLIETAGNFLH